MAAPMGIKRISTLIVTQENPCSFIHAARTAVAAVVSYAIARLFRQPEAYWAPISTLIITQSTLGTSLPISAQRFAGTAVGTVAGAAVVAYFGNSLVAFGIAILLIGLPCACLRVERKAYRYACITLAIVMLVPRPNAASLIALHRFFEVSLGIVVGLTLSAVWPE